MSKLLWIWPGPSDKEKGKRATAVVAMHTERVRIAVVQCYNQAGLTPAREVPSKLRVSTHFGRFTWTLGATPVCRKFFFGVLSIPEGSTHAYMKEAIMGHNPQWTSLKSLHVPRQRQSHKKDLIKAFFTEDGRQCADTMPGRATGGPLVGTGFTSIDVPQQFVLPHSKHLHVYIQFANWAALQQGSAEDLPTFPYFWKTWQKDEYLRRAYVLARDKGTHAACRWCVGWRHLLTLKSLDNKEREATYQELMEHLKLQRGQRDFYGGRVRQARAIISTERPLTVELWLSLAMDAFDGRKSRIPFMKNYTGSFESMVLQLTMMGVLVHHVGVFFYHWDETVVGGSTTAIECLRLTLTQLQDIFKERHWRWPSNIAVQLDNTSKDNKNRFMLGFMADLVLRGKYTSAELNFLMKGHTHNDVDQRFGHIWTYLCRLKVVQTLEVYEHVVSMACSDACGEPLLGFERILVPFDHKNFYLRFLEPLSNFSGAHHFRFILDPRGRVLMRYKRWSVSKYWLPIDPARREQHGKEAFEEALSVHEDDDQPDGDAGKDAREDVIGADEGLKESDIIGIGVDIFGAHPPEDACTPDLAQLRYNQKGLTDFVAGLRRMFLKAQENLPMCFTQDVVYAWQEMLDEHEASLLSVADGQYTAEYRFPFRSDEMDPTVRTEEEQQAARYVQSFAVASQEHRGDDTESSTGKRLANQETSERQGQGSRKGGACSLMAGGSRPLVWSEDGKELGRLHLSHVASPKS